MTLFDLQDGMRVKTREGLMYIVLDEVRVAVGKNKKTLPLRIFCETFECSVRSPPDTHEWDIVAVYEAPWDYKSFITPEAHGKLLWERIDN